MRHWVAFLRAINVGGHTVKNTQLKSLFETLGYTQVETFIASGNVLFNARTRKRDTLEATIESHLKKALGYEVTTFLRTLDEIADLIVCQPFAGSIFSMGESLYIGMLKAPMTEEIFRSLLTVKPESDEFARVGSNFAWLCRTGQGKSTFSNAVFEKTTRMKASFRNITTIRNISAKYSDANGLG